jgi:hypothetical protein
VVDSANPNMTVRKAEHKAYIAEVLTDGCEYQSYLLTATVFVV